jgi:hypothetical protein
MINKHCSWCDSVFQTEISYQIYCSSECREAATKEKMAQKYAQNRRAKRVGKERLCKSCNASLSVYNDDPLCVKCLVNPLDVKKAIKEIKGLSDGKFD